jgi:hypothetical protein
MKGLWVEVCHMIDAGQLKQATEYLIRLGWERQNAWEQVRSIKRQKDWEKAQTKDGTQSHQL